MSKIKKYITTIVILLILFMNIKTNYSLANQTRAEYNGIDENKYPGYASLIDLLKNKYPNWNFTILYTGLDWNYVIKNEYSGHGHSPKSLVQGKSGEWICPICGTQTYDNGSWYCASEAAIAYQMDPRNFLDETNIFQFERYVYVEGAHNRNSIEKLTSGTFVAQSNYTDAFLQAAKKYNVSPVFLASKLLQEQGSRGSTTGIGMTDSDGTKYYNMFNINAYGNNKNQIIQNALNYAKSKGWTTPEQSIIEGAEFIYTNYLQKGLDTPYLQKFDVDSSDGNLFSLQYMQNIQDPETTGRRVANTYKSQGVSNSSFTFVIPVYENMPKDPSPMPSSNKICTKNAIINGEIVNIRDKAGLSGNILKEANYGDEVLVIEEAVSTVDGLYWDKIVLSNGDIAYVASKYLKSIDDITNCNEKVYIIQDVNLRNGPGTTGTSIITTLITGQTATRIQNGTYNKDGYIWDRIILSDGRQGYVATNFISESEISTGEQVKINADGLNLRNEPSINSNIIRSITSGTIVTRIQKAENKDESGYYWDKIVTPDGLEGYVSRCSLDGSKMYIVVLNEKNEKNEEISQNTNMGNNETKVNNEFKINEEEKIILVEPKTTISDITAKEEYKNAISTDEKLGTGSTITIGEKIYTVLKLGDVNGDGYIDTGDTFILKSVIMEVRNFDNENNAKVADINFDNYIDTGDSLMLKREVMDITNIYLKN